MPSSLRIGLLFLAIIVFSSGITSAQPADTTSFFSRAWSLEYEKHMVQRMKSGINRFFDRYRQEVLGQRDRYWKRNLSSPHAYQASVADNRKQLQKIIGLIDQRRPVHMEQFVRNSGSPTVAETNQYTITQIRWPVLSGVWGEGLLVTPKEDITARVVALPDADQLPEDIAGLQRHQNSVSPYALDLAASGVQVLIPVLINRKSTFSSAQNVVPRQPWQGEAAPETLATNQPHREWIYRQAYVMGRHIIGLEIQKVLSGIDWFYQQALTDDPVVGVTGYGEGGLLALYAAAVDTRIDAALVSGYFGPRKSLWTEPLYRNVWGLLKTFGDAEVASLIMPRSLTVEYSTGPTVDGPPPSSNGVYRAAVPGTLDTPPFEAVQQEFGRLRGFFTGGSITPDIELIHGPAHQRQVDPGSEAALRAFTKRLGVDQLHAVQQLPVDQRQHFTPQRRQGKQVQQLTDFLHDLLDTQDRNRYAFMEADWSSPGAWKASMKPYRKHFYEEVIGRIPQELLPPNARMRKVYDREQWTGYEVVLDVWPNVFAWGVLAVPKDLNPGEKRPAVVVQHGHAGTPSTPIRVDSYNNILPRLVKRGFVVFAPHNPYEFNIRKATPLKASVFSVIIPQHQQIVNWLQSQEHVDPERIGFYGKSWGGRTALRVPVYVDDYTLSICSAYFNQWPRKVMSTQHSNTYMRTSSIGVYEFNMGNTLGHAEMAMLLAPKPFMVETGYQDGVAPHEWVGYEFTKVQRVYDHLGIGGRAVLGFHMGGHEVHADTIFPFLHKHLQWPVPPTE